MAKKIRIPVAETRADADTDTVRQPRVQSVAKAVGILLAVARSNDGLRALEIGAQLGLGRQATYHLLHTLVTLGMLTKNGENRYLLGLRVGALAAAFGRHLAPPERITPFVRQVANETGETAYGVGWMEGEIVTLAAIRGRNAIQAAEVPQGLYADPHSRASGKLLLTMADETTRARFLTPEKLVRRTRKTITDPAKLRAEFLKIRELGYAVDQEEYAEGVSCLAVPIDDGDMPYAIGLSAPTERFEKSKGRYLEIVRRIVNLNFERRKAS